MLILTRRISETIKIGDDVKVSVLGVKGNQVRIGIDAPKDVAVHRSEIYDKVKNDRMNNAQAGNVQAENVQVNSAQINSVRADSADAEFSFESKVPAGQFPSHEPQFARDPMGVANEGKDKVKVVVKKRRKYIEPV